MMLRIKMWLAYKWRKMSAPSVLQAYHATFVGNLHGQVVLQHLIDGVYCSVYEGTDPNEALAHNARRSVVHDILLNIDMAENPEKYELKFSEEKEHAA